MELELNKKAPDFTTLDNNGNKFTLKDNYGEWIVLYFYPEDDTEVCNKQACDFRDNMDRITSTGARVIGVSPNGVESHQKFIEKFNLNFTLIIDENLKIIKKYGVWKEKTLYGRKFMGVERATFVIDPKGKIAKIFHNVRTKGHSDRVLQEIEKLKKGKGK